MIAEPSDTDTRCEAPSAKPAAKAAPQGRRVRVADLMVNDRLVILEHGGEDYVLRITAKGKLILTK